MYMYISYACYYTFLPLLCPSSVDLGDGISFARSSTQVDEGVTSQSFRNPYDISRTGLLDQLARMRTNFLHATPTTPNLVEDGVCVCVCVCVCVWLKYMYIVGVGMVDLNGVCFVPTQLSVIKFPLVRWATTRNI